MGEETKEVIINPLAAVGHNVGELYEITKETLQSQLIARGLPEDVAKGPNTDILAKAIVKDTLEQMKILPREENPSNPAE